MADEAQQGTEAPEAPDTTQQAEAPQEPQQAEATEQQAPDPATSTESEADGAEPRKTGVQARISELTQRAKAAEAKVRELQEAQQFAAPQQGDDTLPPVPTPEQFDYDEGRYMAAMADYTAAIQRREIGNALQEQQRNQAAMAQAQALQAQAQVFAARAAEFQQEHPDFQARVSTLGLNPQSPVAQTLLMVDNGPAVAYHMASNPHVAAEVASMPPLHAAVRIAQLSTQLSALPLQPQTQVPTPPKPVSGAAEVAKDPDSMSTEEWLKWRNKNLKEG